MSGAAWAAASGVGFGVFQALNARAMSDLTSAYAATFLQLLAATAVLGSIVSATGDLGAVADLGPRPLIMFALSGLVHFALGWTTLSLSHLRIGAARTSPLLATGPFFGLALGLAVYGTNPTAVEIGGVVVMVAGAVLLTASGDQPWPPLRDTKYAWSTALTSAFSALLTVEGLRDVADPLLGVTVSLAAAAVAYGGILLVVREPLRLREERGALSLKLVASLVVAVCTWGRWLGLETEPIAVVLALQLVSVPVVLVMAPLIARTGVEVVSARLWGGSSVVVVGALLLIGGR